MNAFLLQLAQIGPVRLAIMFGVAAGVALALTSVSMNLGRGGQSLLYSGLDFSETAAITAKLDQAGVSYQLQAGGSAIFVPSADVLSSRLMLSAEGLPASGSVGYEIFDNADALGQNAFLQNVNKIRALEGELARTIQQMDGVASARVHLAMGQRRLFERDQSPPKATVWLELRHGELGPKHARTIRHAVASAVPNLEAGRVTIFDSAGRLLSGGDGEDGGLMMDDRRSAIEDSYRRKIISVVEQIVGPGAVTAQVAADVDFNRVTESAQRVDPDERALVGTTIEESSANSVDQEGDGLASVSENVPETAAEETGEDSSRAESTENVTRETSNWEVSKTSVTRISEVGAIRRLSVAVAVDDVVTVNDAGELETSARSPEQMEQIAALVRSAIGFDEKRGDVVEVTNIGFSRTPVGDGAAADGGLSFGKNDIMRMAELGVLVLVAALVVFFVARPLVSGAVGGSNVPVLSGARELALPTEGGTLVATVDGAQLQGGAPMAVDENGEPVALPAPDDANIDIQKIDGQLKASSVKKISEIVSKHPDESLAIIRNWLHGE